MIPSLMMPVSGVPVPRRGHIHESHIVKMHYLLKIFFILDRNQIKWAYSDDHQGRVNQNCNPQGRGINFCCWWRVSIYNTLTDIAFSSAVLDLFILLICEREPCWKDICIESLIFRWPLRPVGSLLDHNLSVVCRCLHC